MSGIFGFATAVAVAELDAGAARDDDDIGAAAKKAGLDHAGEMPELFLELDRVGDRTGFEIV